MRIGTTRTQQAYVKASNTDFADDFGFSVALDGDRLLVGAFKFATASGGGSLASLLDRLERIEPSGAYKIGFGWLFASPKQWVFVLTAVAVIFAADLRPVASLANYALFTLLVQAVYFVIAGAYLVWQTRVDPLLDVVFGWIRTNLKPTAVGLFAVFGVVFVAKGLTALN